MAVNGVTEVVDALDEFASLLLILNQGNQVIQVVLNTGFCQLTMETCAEDHLNYESTCLNEPISLNKWSSQTVVCEFHTLAASCSTHIG